MAISMFTCVYLSSDALFFFFFFFFKVYSVLLFVCISLMPIGKNFLLLFLSLMLYEPSYRSCVISIPYIYKKIVLRSLSVLEEFLLFFWLCSYSHLTQFFFLSNFMSTGVCYKEREREIEKATCLFLFLNKFIHSLFPFVYQNIIHIRVSLTSAIAAGIKFA